MQRNFVMQGSSHSNGITSTNGSITNLKLAGTTPSGSPTSREIGRLCGSSVQVKATRDEAKQVIIALKSKCKDRYWSGHRQDQTGTLPHELHEIQ